MHEVKQSFRDLSPIHTWFGLTYSSYLVVPRTVMEQMPLDWQEKMTELLEFADEYFVPSLPSVTYRVTAIDTNTGKFIKDPLANYRYPMELQKR